MESPKVGSTWQAPPLAGQEFPPQQPVYEAPSPSPVICSEPGTVKNFTLIRDFTPNYKLGYNFLAILCWDYMRVFFKTKKKFTDFFFQNIFHFSMKTRTQQKILWSIFELFWSEMMPFSYWQSWMHSRFLLFCTK